MEALRVKAQPVIKYANLGWEKAQPIRFLIVLGVQSLDQKFGGQKVRKYTLLAVGGLSSYLSGSWYPALLSLVPTVMEFSRATEKEEKVVESPLGSSQSASIEADDDTGEPKLKDE